MPITGLPSAPPPPPRRCLAVTAQGRPCRAWAVKGGDYCSVHRGPLHPSPARPDPDSPGPKLETLDDLVADMFAKLSLTSAWIERAENLSDFLRGLAVYGRYSAHLAALLREKRSQGRPADPLMATIDQALDQISKEYGIKL